MRIRFLKDEKSSFGEFKEGDVEDIHTPEALRLITAEIAVAEESDSEAVDEDGESAGDAPRRRR